MHGWIIWQLLTLAKIILTNDFIFSSNKRKEVLDEIAKLNMSDEHSVFLNEILDFILETGNITQNR